MRIRKQLKQTLSLILSTLLAVFVFALLLVTIVDLNTDNTRQLISDTTAYEASQVPPQSSETTPPPATEQEYAQEPPVEQPAAPSVAENDAVQIEEVPKAFDLKRGFVVIGFILLVTVIVGGVALLLYSLTRKRFYSYEVKDEDEEPAADEIAESQEWESGLSNQISPEPGQVDEPEPDAGADTINSSESELPEEPDIDFVDIPRLFATRAES